MLIATGPFTYIPTQNYEKYLDKVLAGEPLRREETKDILVNIYEQKYNDVQIAAMLAMLQMRGVTVDELLGFRDGILETGVPAILNADRYVDIVGTGGDQKNTFNISTCSVSLLQVLATRWQSMAMLQQLPLPVLQMSFVCTALSSQMILTSSTVPSMNLVSFTSMRHCLLRL